MPIPAAQSQLDEALFQAAIRGDRGEAKRLCFAGARPDAVLRKWTAFEVAMDRDDLPMFRLLLPFGDPHAYAEQGRGLFVRACCQGKAAFVKIMASRAPFPRALDDDGDDLFDNLFLRSCKPDDHELFLVLARHEPAWLREAIDRPHASEAFRQVGRHALDQLDAAAQAKTLRRAAAKAASPSPAKARL